MSFYVPVIAFLSYTICVLKLHSSPTWPYICHYGHSRRRRWAVDPSTWNVFGQI